MASTNRNKGAFVTQDFLFLKYSTKISVHPIKDILWIYPSSRRIFAPLPGGYVAETNFYINIVYKNKKIKKCRDDYGMMSYIHEVLSQNHKGIFWGDSKELKHMYKKDIAHMIQLSEKAEEEGNLAYAPLANGTILNGKYTIKNIYNSTTTEIIYDAEDNITKNHIEVTEFFPKMFVMRGTDNQLICKTAENADKFKQALSYFDADSQVLKSFDSKSNLSHIKDYFTENNTIYRISDVPTFSYSLDEYIKTNGYLTDEAVIFNICFSLISSIENLHQSGIVHGSICPKYIHIYENNYIELELISGISTNIRDKIFGFTAPEQNNSNDFLNPAMDIFSFGAILYFITTGKTPPYKPDKSGVFIEPSTLNPSAPNCINTIIMTCMQQIPEQRYRSITDVKNAFI